MDMNFRQMIFGAALCAAMAVSADAVAQEQKRAGGESGGISAEMLGLIRSGYKGNACDKAIKNALAGTSIGVLAVNSENAAMMDTHFSDRVRTKGITDQKSSGRCWLFTGLNVLRAKMIDRMDSRLSSFPRIICFSMTSWRNPIFSCRE